MTDDSSLTYSFNGRYISQRLTARIFDFCFGIPCTNSARLHLDVFSQIPFTFELATLFYSCVGYDIEFTQGQHLYEIRGRYECSTMHLALSYSHEHMYKATVQLSQCSQIDSSFTL